ncbi:O-antigen ligase family protein [Stutzerimonas urumqiensis]|uniref:O-antigen ligase family protein n=1 Tax=Stutzerimonas urumqiensis TaxID=638269 RepID=UPI003DA5B4D5
MQKVGANLKAITNLAPICIFALSTATFCLSAIFLWNPSYNWHDQQRASQLALLCLIALISPLLQKSTIPHLAQTFLASIFIIGFYSAITAELPDWAMKEWAKYAGLCMLSLCIGGIAKNAKWQDFLFLLMIFTGTIQAIQFIAQYASAFISGILIINADLLINGFSNPRFLGQFQVMLFPIMAALSERYRKQGAYRLNAAILGILSIQWCIAFSLGGRGLWLGLGLSNIFIILIRRNISKALAAQAMTATLGLFLFVLLFFAIPAWLEIDASVRSSLRADLSERDQIWKLAVDTFSQSPWLGAGPLHYSSQYNPIAAHPHQVILQWLAEWGIFATCMAIVLGGWGLLHSSKLLRGDSDELDEGIWAAICGALVLAQVDGVFVMPYTETWLSLLTGVGLARWSKGRPHKLPTLYIIISIPLVFIFFRILLEIPNLPETEAAFLQEKNVGWAPRFWFQGWIPM